jgi:putative Mg2+ transporter-C (MgtC) family protein
MTLFMSDSLSLCVALALGALIGIERELSDKAAGLRTNILICVGSCLFMIVSKNFTGVLNADPTRIAAQIVTGIGFIGAGAIMEERRRVIGLTTAATIWVVAAVGVAVGVGSYALGAATTALTLLVQIVFPRLDVWVDDHRQRYTYRISSEFDERGLEEIKTLFREARVKVLSRKVMKKDEMYHSEWYVSGPRLDHKELARKLLENAHVKELTY